MNNSYFYDVKLADMGFLINIASVLINYSFCEFNEFTIEIY
jgi:hypothetical protein